MQEDETTVTSATIIDEIDAKILRDLLKDGRKEFTEIAEDAHVSKHIIWQHYANMKKEGIIVGATIQLDYAALGYNLAASFSIRTPPQKQQQVIEQLRKIPGLYDAYRWGSHSRIWAVSDLMRTDQLERVKQSIKELPSVTGLEVEVWTGMKRMPDNLSLLGNDKTSSRTEGRAENKTERTEGKIDETDRQIIEQLAVNGRASFSDIGRKVGISTSTAARRYDILKRNGIIRPLIQINPSKMGYPFEVNFRLKTDSKQSTVDISEKIAKIPDVVGILKTTSIYDLSVNTAVKNFEHLIALETEISEIQGVTEMDTDALNELTMLPYPREHTSTF